jgi:hypothetical protein
MYFDARISNAPLIYNDHTIPVKIEDCKKLLYPTQLHLPQWFSNFLIIDPQKGVVQNVRPPHTQMHVCTREHASKIAAQMWPVITAINGDDFSKCKRGYRNKLCFTPAFGAESHSFMLAANINWENIKVAGSDGKHNLSAPVPSLWRHFGCQ